MYDIAGSSLFLKKIHRAIDLDQRQKQQGVVTVVVL
jgi:hypothetical protein